MRSRFACRGVQTQAGYSSLRRWSGRRGRLRLCNLQMRDLSFDLRSELVRGAAQFGEKASGLTSHLRQLLWPKKNEGQEEQEDGVGKAHGLIIMRAGDSGNAARRAERFRLDANLLWRGLENYRVALVAGDDAVELSQVVGFINGHAQLFYFEGAGIADNVSSDHSLGVITGEAVVHIDGRGQIIYGVSGGYGDFEGIGIARRLVQFDRKLPGFFGLQESEAFVSDHARPQQKQVAGILGVVLRLKRVVKAEGLVGLLNVEEGRVGDVKIGHRISK